MSTVEELQKELDGINEKIKTSTNSINRLVEVSTRQLTIAEKNKDIFDKCKKEIKNQQEQIDRLTIQTSQK